jgi:DNA mismatch repair ATPase MutS
MIGRTDDLLTGRSYYIEVESLLELVRASEGSLQHLFLLDELFRGTNAIERIRAGQAVFRELVARPIRTWPFPRPTTESSLSGCPTRTCPIT